MLLSDINQTPALLYSLVTVCMDVSGRNPQPNTTPQVSLSATTELALSSTVKESCVVSVAEIMHLQLTLSVSYPQRYRDTLPYGTLEVLRNLDVNILSGNVYVLQPLASYISFAHCLPLLFPPSLCLKVKMKMLY